MLGRRLYNIFQKKMHKYQNKVIEDDLFWELLNSLNELGPFTTLIHGPHKTICFEVDKKFYLPRKKPKKYPQYNKELGDLLIVTYSPQNNEARYTFMQNKYNKTGKPFPFQGDLLQWSLLNQNFYNTLPQIVSIKKSKLFNWVNDQLFQDALLPSIGSFGVFYIDNSKKSKKYQMGYFRANELDVRRQKLPYIAFSKRMGLAHLVPANTLDATNKLYPDCIWCDNLIDFGDHLEKLEIGTPLDMVIKKRILETFPDAPEDFINGDFFVERQYRDHNLNDVQNDNDKTNPINAVFINIDKMHEEYLSFSLDSTL